MSDLALVLSEGVEALRDGQADRAADLLAVVAEDPELAAAGDLQDIRLRVLTLYAQALLQSGRAAAARHPLQAARDLVQTLDLPEATTAVDELETQIGAAISEGFAARARARTLRSLAARPVEELLSEAPVAGHAQLLVERAAAALEVGRPDEAAQIAERALALAADTQDLRHQVLALLALSRARPERRHELLEEARRRTDQADAFDLLAFVVKAADQAGVTLTVRSVHEEPES